MTKSELDLYQMKCCGENTSSSVNFNFNADILIRLNKHRGPSEESLSRLGFGGLQPDFTLRCRSHHAELNKPATRSKKTSCGFAHGLIQTYGDRRVVWFGVKRPLGTHFFICLPEDTHRSIGGQLDIGLIHKHSLEAGIGVATRQNLLIELKNLM